jgi:hypothetical protein
MNMMPLANPASRFRAIRRLMMLSVPAASVYNIKSG